MDSRDTCQSVNDLYRLPGHGWLYLPVIPAVTVCWYLSYHGPNQSLEEREVWAVFLYREQLFPFFGGVTLMCFCWVGCACLQVQKTNLPYFYIFHTAMVFEAAILQGQVRITKQTKCWNWKKSELTETLTGSDSLPSFQLDYKLCAVKFSHKQTITVSGK